MRQRLLIATLMAFALSGALSSISYFGVHLSAAALIASRWIAIGIFSSYALYRRSLTTWILVAMLAGAAIGHDWPAVAVNLRVLSQIFLRLIKTIIAPLLFATLVSGIASHADLKKVGRMGVKALVFFEVVTTLALVIGLAAINLSKAGVGATLPSPGNEPLQVQKLGVSDTILHVFPENIAK
jgi:proton glutamate symport protein